MSLKKSTSQLPAIRLYTKENGDSAFQEGFVSTLTQINNQNFWFSNTIETWQEGTHTAPCRQFVVTLKGILKFKVSTGETFLIKPGIILLAEDITGKGHSWELIDSDEWQRIYIPIHINEESHFKKDLKTKHL